MRKTLVNLLLILMSVVGAERITAQQQAAPPPSKFKMTSVFSDGTGFRSNTPAESLIILRPESNGVTGRKER